VAASYSRDADAIAIELKELLGGDFPANQAAAGPFVIAVIAALDSYALLGALQRSQEDAYTTQQLGSLLKCALQLQALIQPNDPIQPYRWQDKKGRWIERPALNSESRILDLIGRAGIGKSSAGSTATVRASLDWLVETTADVLRIEQTDWGIAKKRQRGARAGRRQAQVTLAVQILKCLWGVGVRPKRISKRMMAPKGYSKLVRWAFKQVPQELKKGGRRTGDWAAVSKLGLQEFLRVNTPSR
jgi:hypothetical protein